MSLVLPKQIAVIGLGYVGLPLAAEFGKYSKVIGFDINAQRVNELRSGKDSTLEVSDAELAESKHLLFTDNVADLQDCDFYIVTVPTPVDDYKTPDLTPLEKASAMLGKVISKGDIVVYESTVFPGATEEVCVPILEKVSGLKFNQDFFAGYSPERINPGDKEHRVTDIKKVTAGSTPEIAKVVDAVYNKVIKAGTHLASSIRVAEAAKVIENTQRDVNIALINELSLLFDKLGIDTQEVLDAAGTKWNFLPFRPGLVGGHCIGVDPYYLTYKAQEVGFHAEMITAGRRVNDHMGEHVANRIIRLMLKKQIPVLGANVLVLGLTFKENCPDLRNTKVIDVITELQDMDINVDIYDPWIDVAEAKHEYGLDVLSEMPEQQYDAVVLAVSHHQFVSLSKEQLQALGKESSVLFDIKSLYPKDWVDGRL